MKYLGAQKVFDKLLPDKNDSCAFSYSTYSEHVKIKYS